MQKLLRQRLRARLLARLAAARAGRSRRPEELAAREARLTTTAADVLAYRKREGLSQRDLAARLGVTRSEVAECERGRRPGLRVREWVDQQLAAPAAAR